jgi:hypothetical protein
MAYQVMQDTEGDYYIVSSKYAPDYLVVSRVEGMYQCLECSGEDIFELHAQPQLSASKLSFEWVRKPSTWEALMVFNEAIKAKLPGDLPAEKEYVKKEFKLADSKVALNRISLADLCVEQKWEPAQVRRILRKNGLKPSGRWEWDKSGVSRVILLVSKEYKAK